MPIWGILGHVIVIHETTNRVKRQFLGPQIFNSLVIQKPLDTESVVVKTPSQRLTCWSSIGAAFFSLILSLHNLALELWGSGSNAGLRDF